LKPLQPARQLILDRSAARVVSSGRLAIF